MTKHKRSGIAEKLDPLQWDLEELMERLDGDEAFLQELLEIFRQDGPANLLKSRDALAAGDFSGLTHAAHTLKGMLKNLAMRAAAEKAAALETAARKESIEGSRQCLEELVEAIESLFPEVEARLAEAKL